MTTKRKSKPRKKSKPRSYRQQKKKGGLLGAVPGKVRRTLRREEMYE